MKKINIILGILILIGLFIFLNGCAKIEESVKIGYLPITVDLATFVAQEKGYFQEQGLNVELIELATSNQIAEALISKNIDVGSYFAYPVVFSIEENQPNTFKEIGTVIVSSEYPFLFILAPKDDFSIKTIADLKGKTVGMFPGSTTQAQLSYALKSLGVDPTTVIMQPLSPAQHLNALSSGSVDALFSLEPTPTIGEIQGISRKVENIEKYLPEPNYNAITAVTKDFARENAEVVLKVKAAHDKAIDYIRSNPKEAKKVLTKYTTLSEEIALKTGIGYPLKSTELRDIKKVQEYADMLYEEGDLKNKIDASNLFN